MVVGSSIGSMGSNDSRPGGKERVRGVNAKNVLSASPERAGIDKALAIGEPLRDIARRVSISKDALLRHKSHVALAITKAQERREEKLGDSVFDGIKRLQDRVLGLLDKMESEGDHRGAVLASREARECLLSANELLARAEALKAGSGGELVVRVVHIVGA